VGFELKYAFIVGAQTNALEKEHLIDLEYKQMKRNADCHKYCQAG
jgi:hypothetical protein